MDIKIKKELSIFKFSLIAPVVNKTFNASSKMEYFRNVAKLSHKLPSGKEVKYSSMTIKKWYLKYMKGGLESLEPKTRNDANSIDRYLTISSLMKVFFRLSTVLVIAILYLFYFSPAVLIDHCKCIKIGTFIKSNTGECHKLHRIVRV